MAFQILGVPPNLSITDFTPHLSPVLMDSHEFPSVPIRYRDRSVAQDLW